MIGRIKMSKQFSQFQNYSNEIGKPNVNLNMGLFNRPQNDDDIHSIFLIGNVNNLSDLKKELIKGGFNLFVVESPSEKFIIKHALEIDVIITSFDMMENTINILKESKILLSLFIPVIVYSPLNSSINRKVSFLQGVDDFIPFSIDMYEVIIRINHQIERKRLLNSIVFTDELTGAYNRKYLRTFYLQFASLKKPLIFVLIDLDYFKRINDTYGYVMGDTVLETFVTTAKKFIGQHGVITRFGGDEFLILLQSISIRHADNIIKNMLTSFSEIRFEHQGTTFNSTFSAGVIRLYPTYFTLNQILEKAQVLLDMVKSEGEGQVYTIKNNNHYGINKK